MRKDGFTLAELLLALVILGVIATFTIPKVLSSQQASTWKSNSKDVAASISAAMEEHKRRGLFSYTTQPEAIYPYLNYVKRTTVDTGDLGCAGLVDCLILHNGGVMRGRVYHFGGTASTNMIRYEFDPDIQTSADGIITFYYYYGGRITTRAGIDNNSCDDNVCHNPAADPTWFSWD